MSERILYGKRAAEAKLGKQAIKDAICSIKYPGEHRKKPRGDWWPYVFERAGDYWVTSEDPSKLQKQGGFAALYGALAALDYAERLDNGEQPFTPPEPTRRPQAWEVGENLLALDIEGIETLDRISLATETQAGSWQWSQGVRAVTQAAVNQADWVMGWSLDYDVTMLERYGVYIPEGKRLDLMYAHQTLNPWRNNGLGKAAPLYVMTQPWKHLSQADAAYYNLMDSAILIPMFDTIKEELEDRGQWAHFTEIDIPFLNALHRMEAQPVKLQSGDWWHRSYKPLFKGNYSDEDRTLLHFEAKPSRSGALDGSTFEIDNPTELAISILTGEDLPPQTEMIRRHLQGYGPGQAKKGKADRGDLALDITFPYYKEACAKFDSDHPLFAQWYKTTEHLRKKEHFVTNPFGRRCYSPKMPHRWLVESTICDIIKHIVTNGPLPLHFTENSVTYQEETDFGQLLDSAIKEARCE